MDNYSKTYTEAEIAAWRLDPAESFALVEITPVRYPTRTAYRISAHLAIRPYPNPLRMGGEWASGGPAPRLNVMGAARHWLKGLDRWRERGLTNIKLVRKPADYRAEPREIPPPAVAAVRTPDKHRRASGQQMSFL